MKQDFDVHSGDIDSIELYLNFHQSVDFRIMIYVDMAPCIGPDSDTGDTAFSW